SRLVSGTFYWSIFGKDIPQFRINPFFVFVPAQIVQALHCRRLAGYFLVGNEPIEAAFGNNFSFSLVQNFGNDAECFHKMEMAEHLADFGTGTEGRIIFDVWKLFKKQMHVLKEILRFTLAYNFQNPCGFYQKLTFLSKTPLKRFADVVWFFGNPKGYFISFFAAAVNLHQLFL